MRNAHRILASLALAAALFSGAEAVSGQALPLDLEVGYRFVDVSGNERMYRTQINDALLTALPARFSDGRVIRRWWSTWSPMGAMRYPRVWMSHAQLVGSPRRIQCGSNFLPRAISAEV